MGRNLSLRTRRLLARGIGPRVARRWAGAQFLSPGVGDRAAVTLGTGNSQYALYAKTPGTGGNAITFRVVVSGANTTASVSVAGSAITFNSATNGASAATSKVSEMIRLVNGDATAGPLVRMYTPEGSDGTGTVAAVAATALSGAV